MTSLCRHLSVVSTGNCKLGHDCRRVCSHRRRDATRQFRLVGVSGVYWALEMSSQNFEGIMLGSTRPGLKISIVECAGGEKTSLMF